MEKLSGICFFSLLFCHLAQAALPPTAESMRRIKAIVESKVVYDTLGSANWINAISQQEDGYLIETDKCTLPVQVNAKKDPNQPPNFVGPLLLEVTVGTINCH